MTLVEYKIELYYDEKKFKQLSKKDRKKMLREIAKEELQSKIENNHFDWLDQYVDEWKERNI